MVADHFTGLEAARALCYEPVLFLSQRQMCISESRILPARVQLSRLEGSSVRLYTSDSISTFHRHLYTCDLNTRARSTRQKNIDATNSEAIHPEHGAHSPGSSTR